jgi:hypothetical protein
VIVLVAGIALAGCAARATHRGNVSEEVNSPRSGPVCLLKSPLPESVRHKVIGQIDAGKRWYGGTGALMPLMADEGRKLGADAVVNIRSGQKIGLFAWATPYAYGTAVKIEDAKELNCLSLGGELR